MAEQTARNWSSGDIVTAANLSSIERGVSAVAEEYTPTTWANGNTVTAAALNNIEQGIVNSGSSDFSTAEVTVNASKDIQISAPVIYEAGELSPKTPALINGFTYIHDYDGELTLTMALYKGSVLINFYTEGNVSSTGNITVKGSQALITGDCTITISNSSIQQYKRRQ